MFLFALLSCTSPCPEGSARRADGLCELTDTGAPTGSASSISPQMDGEEAIDLLTGVLSLGLVEGVALQAVYAEALSQRDSTCPPMENAENSDWFGVWSTLAGESCTSESGYVYFGLALASLDLVEEDGSEGLEFGLLASFSITDPDGEIFIGGGSGTQSWYVDADGGISWHTNLGGTFSYPPAGGWIGGGVESSIFFSGTRDGDHDQAEFIGGIGYPDADISFDDLTYDSEREPHLLGAVRVRDDSGYWYRLELHETDCGTLIWQEQEVGDYCAPLTAAVEELLDTVTADPR